MIYIIVTVLSIIGFLYSLYIEHNKSKCPHGIANGNRIVNSKMKCPECDREYQEKLEQIKKEQHYKAIQKAVLDKFASSVKKAVEEKKSVITSNEETLLKMDPKQFEDVVAELFRRMGYEVIQTPYTNDGGKDAYLNKDGQHYMLECKRYKNHVGRPALQKLVGAMRTEDCQNGIFVTTSNYSREAKDYADECQRLNIATIRLIAMEELLSLLRQYRMADEKNTFSISCPVCGEYVTFDMFDDLEYRQCINNHPVKNIFWQTSAHEPICLRCGNKLVPKIGRYGKYYACSGTDCRYTISAYEYGVENRTIKPTIRKGYYNGIYID